MKRTGEQSATSAIQRRPSGSDDRLRGVVAAAKNVPEEDTDHEHRQHLSEDRNATQRSFAGINAMNADSDEEEPINDSSQSHTVL